MKKWSCLLVAVAMLLSLLVVPTAADSTNAAFNYELTYVVGGQKVQDLSSLKVGDTVEVTLTATRTDTEDASYQTYGVEFYLKGKGLTWKSKASNASVADVSTTFSKLASPTLRTYVTGTSEISLVWGDLTNKKSVEAPNPLVVTCTCTVNSSKFRVWVENPAIYLEDVGGVAVGNEQHATLTLNANGGSIVGTDVSGSVLVGETVTLPGVSKSGFNFVNWSDGDGSIYKAGDSYTVKYDVTLTAQWECDHANKELKYEQGEGYHTVTTVCRACGTTIKTERESCSYEQRSSATEHWQQCAKCGYTTSRAVHTFVSGTCSVCKYVNTGTSTTGTTGTTNNGNTASAAATTETVTPTTNADGSTTTSVTNSDGSVTTTTTTTTGVTGAVTTNASGDVTSVSASVPAAVAALSAETGSAVTLPVEVTATRSSANAPAIAISVPSSVGQVKVEIPVENVTSGSVAVLVHADGTEEIVRTSTVTADGVALSVSGDVTVKIIDNSKSFVDTPAWAADSIAFVSSRELFNGTSADTFTPNSPTTRAQLMTVLARLDGQTAQATSQGMAWAVEKGISDGSNPGGSILRQQLAVMLYRYAGSPATDGSIAAFPDAGNVSDYANAAMKWAVDNGIIGGTTDGRLNPTGLATRAQVAAMVARYVAKIG